MADDALAESSEIKLEAKRKVDGSWHPCQVNLCSGGGLSVTFEGHDVEDMILDVEDALSCLRVRSVPLQGDDCSHIEDGKLVLAAFEKGSQRLFFDAVVQKANRVRHSKRASCRCTFIIKWQFENFENEITTVPSRSIFKLATERINSHSMVAAFLNSMEKSYMSSASSPTAFDDIEAEVDLHGLLKQIEGINNYTGSSNIDSLLGVECGGRNVLKNLVSEQVSKCDTVNGEKSHLRRSSRRQNTAPPTIENHVTSELSSIEKSEQNQSPLSPLAARAVLASLVSKLPPKTETIVQEERKCVSVLDYSKTVRDFRGSCTPVLKKVESSVTSKRADSGKNLHVQKSNGTLAMEVCDEIEPLIDSRRCLSSSIRNEESTLPVVGSRLTRSAMKRESGKKIQDDETTPVSENATSVRVTRSAVLRGNNELADRVGENLQDKKVRVTRSTCPTTNNETKVLDEEDNITPLNKRGKCSILISSTTRVTRSAAQVGTKSLDVKANGSSHANPKSESIQLEDSVSQHEEVVSTKKREFPVINSEPNLVENNKKQKGLVLDRFQSTTVDALKCNVATRSQNTNLSSCNKHSRFSPQLRSSPRLQSHHKS